jgi:hypothetical protein
MEQLLRVSFLQPPPHSTIHTIDLAWLKEPLLYICNAFITKLEVAPVFKGSFFRQGISQCPFTQ